MVAAVLLIYLLHIKSLQFYFFTFIHHLSSSILLNLKDLFYNQRPTLSFSSTFCSAFEILRIYFSWLLSFFITPWSLSIIAIANLIGLTASFGLFCSMKVPISYSQDLYPHFVRSGQAFLISSLRGTTSRVVESTPPATTPCGQND